MAPGAEQMPSDSVTAKQPVRSGIAGLIARQQRQAEEQVQTTASSDAGSREETKLVPNPKAAASPSSSGRPAQGGARTLGLQEEPSVDQPEGGGGEEDYPEEPCPEEWAHLETATGEGLADGDADQDDVEWEECFACPLSIRFTQDNIHPFFYRRGPIVNVLPKIRISICNLLSPALGNSRPSAEPELPAFHERGELLELAPPFQSIHCLRKGKTLWSLDNRRLYALQLAAMEWWPWRCCVRVFVCDKLSRKKFKTQYRKFKTQSEGTAIHVAARFQKFDHWSWFEHAVELEWHSFSQRVGVLLSIFEIGPILGSLLFRTGYTGFASRTPFVICFLLAISVDFVRQKIPSIERSVSKAHVRAVSDGDAQRCGWPCCRGRSKPSAGSVNVGGGVVLSAPTLAALMSLFLALTLPYIVLLERAKLRSSLLSCWLGIACVLVAQAALAPRSVTGSSEGGLTPKHRYKPGLQSDSDMSGSEAESFTESEGEGR